MNRFYTTVTKTLDTANYLDEIGYQELDSIVLKDDDNEPIQILIDKEQQTFCFMDSEGLAQQTNELRKINEIIQLSTFKEILSWKN